MEPTTWSGSTFAKDGNGETLDHKMAVSVTDNGVRAEISRAWGEDKEPQIVTDPDVTVAKHYRKLEQAMRVTQYRERPIISYPKEPKGRTRMRRGATP